MFYCATGERPGLLAAPPSQDMGGVHPPASSCRAGAVVSMLGLNGAKIPVKLEIKSVEHSTKDRVEHLHIVKVSGEAACTLHH